MFKVAGLICESTIASHRIHGTSSVKNIHILDINEYFCLRIYILMNPYQESDQSNPDFTRSQIKVEFGKDTISKSQYLDPKYVINHTYWSNGCTVTTFLK